MSDGPRPTLWYLYDEPLPNRYAASIQILRTGAAFAEAGGRFVFLAGPLGAAPDAIAERYGIACHPGLELRGFFRPRGRWSGLRGALQRRDLRRLSAEIAALPGRHVLMSRGATGIAALPALRRGLGHGGRVPLIHEMHCLQYLRDAEKRAGRMLDEAAPGPQTDAARACEARALAAADAFVFLTPAVEAAARRTFAIARPSLVLPSGTEPCPAAAPAGPPRHDVVYAGKLEARKGVGTLVSAMHHLPGRRLGLAGGPAAAAREFAARLAAEGLSASVDVLGELPPAEVGGFLRGGRVGVCPMPGGVDSVSERFTSPMKLLQMMANGLAIVASDLPPVRALVTDGREALLVPPGDPVALAAAVERLIVDRDLAARLGAAARSAAERYAWPERAARLATFLEARLTGGAVPAGSAA